MIKSAFKYSPLLSGIVIVVLFGVFAIISSLFITQAHAAGQKASGKKLITIHDRGQERVVLTTADSVNDALKEANITLDENDAVEPKLDEQLIDKNYYVNIYRARPVIVVDGNVREKIMTPYQTAGKIAAHAGLKLNDEDNTSLRPTEDIISEGAGVELQIDRATPFTLMLYGKKTDAYTQAATVDEMFKQKGIPLSSNDHVSVPLDTEVTAGMTVALWRDGKQTVTEEKEVPFETEKVYDAARPAGFRDIRTPGVAGTRAVTYEVDMQGGKEIGRKEILNVVTKEPKKQIEVVGLNPANGLSKSKGAHTFTDSKGVAHRETYYDLPMSVVMGACGAGGHYIVRPDGVKVDKDGYVIIAAHLGNYPRCSVVETSLGPGKVYDTGGFAARHPHGFDLATDWTNNDGR